MTENERRLLLKIAECIMDVLRADAEALESESVEAAEIHNMLKAIIIESSH